MDVTQIRQWLRNFFSTYNIPVSVDDDGKVLNKPIYAEVFVDVSSNLNDTFTGQKKKVLFTIDINIYSSRPYDISDLKSAIMNLNDNAIPTVTIEAITFRRVDQSPSYNQWNIGIDVSYLT